MELVPGKLYTVNSNGKPIDNEPTAAIAVHRYNSGTQDFKGKTMWVDGHAALMFIKALDKKNKRKVLFLYGDQLIWLFDSRKINWFTPL